MLKKLTLAAGMVLAAVGGAMAQGGELGPGQVLGNPGATPAPAEPSDLTSILDRAFGSTRGSLISRGASAWGQLPPGTSGYGLIGNGAGADASYQGYLAYSGTTPRTWQSKAGDGVSVMDYAADHGCVPNSVADCTAALNAAMLAEYNRIQSGGPIILSTGGTVRVPATPGCFRYTSALVMQNGVSLVGEGGLGSCLMADDTDGLSFTYTNGFGQVQLSNLFLYGCKFNPDPPTPHCDPPTAPRTAIKRPQTLVPANADTDSQYGLSIQNTLIWGFDTAIDVTTLRYLWITNSYFQNVNNCAKINGFSFGVRFQGFQCKRDNGDGLGAIGDGIVAGPYTYDAGINTGPVGPESIRINQSDIHGFNTAVWLKKGAATTITNSDVLAYVDGVRFSDIFGGLSVKNTYFDMIGSAVHAGIWGESVASSNRDIHHTELEGNTLVGTGTSSANCIQINEPGTTNQDNINAINNHCRGFTSKDFIAYNPGAMTVERNFFESLGTGSISIGTRQTGVIKVQKNHSASTNVAVTAADVTNGYVRFCDNVSSGSSLDGCDIYTPTIHGTMTAGPINAGAISASTFNNIQLPIPASTAVLALGSGKTLTASNTTTITSTDGATIAAGGGGTVLYNGGALGSPSSAGTLPAHTLGGAISGGGNLINNVVIGAGAPLAGTFTTLQANASGNFGNSATPDATLTVNNNSGATVAPGFGVDLHLIGADSAIAGILSDAYNGESAFTARVAGGTRAAKTALGSGFLVAGYGAKAYDGTAYRDISSFEFITLNAQTGSDHSARARLRLVPSGSTTLTDVMLWGRGVAIGSGAADPGAGNLNLGGGVLQNNGTSPTGTGAYVRAISPALTGSPTAPTAAANDNSTKIATTAYVDAAWTSYTPGSIASETVGGTPATYTLNSARYKQIGKTITVAVDVTVTNQGVGNSGAILISLPFTGAAFAYVGSLVEYNTTGDGGAVFLNINATRMYCAKATYATALIVTGYRIAAQVTYEIP